MPERKTSQAFVLGRQTTMVLSPAIDAHPVAGRFPFRPHDGHHQEEVEHFHTWRPARRITTGAVRLTDYNFKTPAAAMEAEQAGDAAHAQGGIESFLYPGGYPDQTRGRLVARLRTGQARGQDRRIEAMGDIPALGAGCRVGLSGDPVPGTGEEFLCLAAEHSYSSNSYGSGSGGDDHAYSGSWVLMPSDAPLMPERKTPRATVAGPQTAVVVGEGEIDCDEYGRILVRFHWDLEDAHSMRCRVSQSWSGNGWGGMVIPRVGMEVVVEFLEGDPDQPLVTGCVYNGRNTVPYELPEHKTRSTFRSKTHQGQGFNELRFEDKAGEEEIFVHAERNANFFTKNDFARITERNMSIQTRGQRHEIVERSSLLEVGKSLTIRTGNRQHRTPLFKIPLNPAQMNRIGAQIEGDNILDNTSTGDFEIIAGNNIELSASASLTASSGDNMRLFSAQNINLEATGRFSVDARKQIEVGSARQISIRSAKRIRLTTGAGYLEIDERGNITIAGSAVNILSGGSIIINGKRISMN